MASRDIPLKEAEFTAFKIVEYLGSLCEKIMVAGSLRRKRPFVHDIDIVVIPNPLMWSGSVPNTLLKQLGAEMTKNGPLVKQFTIDGIQVDLIHATRQNWGIRTLRWTGSAAHNIKLCTKARSLDMKLAVSKGLLNNKGEIIESRDEKEIFKQLGFDYVDPIDREVNY